MKKSKVTRSLMAAVSIVALTTVMYGCVHDGDSDDTPAVEMPDPDPALGAAMTAAMAAATAADKAADAAEDAVTAQAANQSADPISYALAQNAAERAREAATAAAEAYDVAKAADTVAAAEAAQADAEAAQAVAEEEQANAIMYAGDVGDDHQANVDADTERQALEAAQGAAATAAKSAREAATAAKTASEEATGLVGADHRFAVAAKDAADKAEAAAKAAEAANDMAQSAGTSGEAQGNQETAEAEQSDAEMYLAEASKQRDNAKAAQEHAEDLEEKRIEGVLGEQRSRASGAAEDAGTAADEAGDSADDAEGFAVNRALIQTGEANSVEDAEKSREYAEMAKGEAAKAQDASGKAAAAETEADARKYADMAEDHQKAAEDFQSKAKMYRDEADKDSMLEVKVDGKTKSVGDTMIMVGAERTETTIGGVTHITGEIEKIVDGHMGTRGIEFRNTPGTPPHPDIAEYMQEVAPRSNLEIGFRVDSADDKARLTLVTGYIGVDKGKVFAQSSTPHTGTEPGMVSSNPGTVNNDVTLKSEGMFYRAGTATGREGEFLMVRIHRNTGCDLCCPCVAMPERSAGLGMHSGIDVPSSCRGDFIAGLAVFGNAAEMRQATMAGTADRWACDFRMAP